MVKEYMLWSALVAGERIIISIQDGSIKNVLYEVFLSNKSIFEISMILVNNYNTSRYSLLQKYPVRPFVHKIQIGTVVLLLGACKILWRFVVMNIPVAIYLAVFDHYDSKFYKISGSRGIFDSIVIVLLIIILSWSAYRIVQEAAVSRQMYFQSQAYSMKHGQ